MNKCANKKSIKCKESKDSHYEALNILSLCHSLLDINCESISAILDLSSEVEVIRKRESKLLPYRLNLLESFATGNLKETAHSRFLWNLLRLPKIMDSFMARFFGEINEPETKYKVNYPDKYRIDISVEGQTDFFIIENKINDADEQCGQIYRYVTHGLKIGYKAENIHVLYINSQTHDTPSDYSLSKDGKGVSFIPEGVAVNVISYKDEIIKWLLMINSDINEDETYLKSALFQYIDYLKEKFKISDRYNDMNNKISSIIKERLFDKNMSTPEKLNVLSDTMEQLDNLKSNLEILQEKEIACRFQEWFNDLIKQYPLVDYNWIRDNETDIHVDFLYHGYKLAACLTIDNGLCWGIKCINKPLTKKYSAELHSEVQLYLPRVQSEEWWPAWDYTSYANGLERFITLIKCLKGINVLN